MRLGIEGENVEFKKSTAQLSKAMDNVASTLNKSGSGILYFGVPPDGEVAGQEANASTLNDVAETIKNAIKPMICPNADDHSRRKENHKGGLLRR